MKNIIRIQCLIVVLLIVLSCSDDLGNYNYNAINEIEVTGFEDEYTTLFGDSFSLKPTINFTQDDATDENRYTYSWFVMTSRGLPMDQREDLATTKNLELESLTVPPGSYELVYEITDQETEITWQFKVPLNIRSAIYEGWLLLNKTASGSRLDMITYLDKTFTPIIDVLDYSNSSLKLEGEPVQIHTYSHDPQFYGIFVTTTGNGTTKIEPETFGWQETYRLAYDMVSNVPTDFGADFITRANTGAQSSYMYKDGDVFYYLRVQQWKYGSPINYINEEQVTISPFIAAVDYGESIFYDVTNKRFLRHHWQSSNMNEMPNGTLFDYTTGKDLLYMGRTTYNGGEAFAILEDTNNSDLYLARMAQAIFGSVSQSYYEKIPSDISVEMKQAEHFAISPDFGYLFYNVGSKVYQYDFSLKTSKLMLDKGANEITLLKFDDGAKSAWGASDEYNYTNMLQVASTDNTPGGGLFEIYEVPPVNGTIKIVESYSGFDRIVGSSYRFR